jgi:SAM-dependent methyltransferase
MGTGYLYDIFRASERRNKERILELARPAPGGRLLDLGCNDGAFTMELVGRVGAAEAYGVEFVDSLAGEARGRGVEVVSNDLNEPLPYDSDSFDVVHSNQVIEHLVKTDTFVREIRRVLRPSGYALISTNNLASWHNLFSLVLGMQPMPCHVSDELVLGNSMDPRRGEEHPEKGFTHLRIFSYRALQDLLELHGLRVDQLVTSGYYPFPPPVADVLCRIDRWHGAFLIAVATPGGD